MAVKKVNKVILNNTVLIDLTEDTVATNTVKTSEIFHLPNGEIAEGTMEMSKVVVFNLQNNLITTTYTPSEVREDFVTGNAVIGILHDVSSGVYEHLYKINTTSTQIIFSLIYQNTLGGGFTHKKIIGDKDSNVWTYEIS